MSDGNKQNAENTPEHSSEEEERKREGTTSKTLSDIEETQEISEDQESEKDRIPEPDAQAEEKRQGFDDAGPM